jgi:hypothetical protein
VEGLATTADGRGDPKLDKMGIDFIDYRNANRLSRLQPATVLFGVTARSISVGAPRRTARLVTIATLLSILAAEPVSAFDIRSDKNLVDSAVTNLDDWTKDFEAELAPLASDMWGTQKRLEGKGFRVDRGNKSGTGWWLTASNRNTSRSIKVQSDGAKIVVTVER